MDSRVPISAADVAKIIEIMGVDRVIALDLHSGQITNCDKVKTTKIGKKCFKQSCQSNSIFLTHST